MMMMMMMSPYHDILNTHSTKLNYPIRSSVHPSIHPSNSRTQKKKKINEKKKKKKKGRGQNNEKLKEP